MDSTWKVVKAAYRTSASPNETSSFSEVTYCNIIESFEIVCNNNNTKLTFEHTLQKVNTNSMVMR